MNSLKFKILLVAILPIILTIILLSMVNINSLISSNERVVYLYEQDMLKDKQQLIKNQIATVSKVIDAILLKTPDIEEAKRKIIFVLSHIRYLENKSGYFFAYTQKEGDYYFAFHGVKTQLNNKKADITKPDIKGFAFRKALIDSGKEDKFISYHYQKPNTDKILKKIAYAKYIEKLNWTLVTGIYIDDIYKQINKMKKSNKHDLQATISSIVIISVILLSLSSIIVVLIVKKVLITPLNTIQSGINSFFNYLVDSSQKVKSIHINSKDEFGEMTKSVNNSMKVSMQLHDNIANLMMTLDKHVITMETDVNGVITYASMAFCSIANYTRDELIGHSSNIVRCSETPDSVYKQLWETIEQGNVWSGELKNRTKDNHFYWVKMVITPKKISSGEISGYTAIQYGITDKKAVEDLTANLEVKIEERTADLAIAKKQIEATHKHTRESIEYAALIQGALLPEQQIFSTYFKDSFTLWTPKDTVGGDIYLFNELRHKDECLFLFIDCTGHGVPGAFVTMLVKAVEAQIIAEIMNSPDMDVSPAKIMSVFNQSLKKLLKQESAESVSNAGWDGGIIYYNRNTQILKFAGAETPLFYIDTENELQTIKGNRYSVGYKKCAMDYQYKETILNVKEGMKFYCTTDGYLDQNGGEKDFPFGKKRFQSIIKSNHKLLMKEQKNLFISEMSQYESTISDNDRNDDMTVIGFTIDSPATIAQTDSVEILQYDGVMTQNVIAACMDNIEHKITNMGMMNNLSTLTIELCQNMMNYSKTAAIGCREIEPAGFISIIKYADDSYLLQSKNIISGDDKEKIEPTIIEIQSLDKDAIKKRYRELRRSGKNTHSKGGGIGFYEIAKLSSSIDYQFSAINGDKYLFKFNITSKPRSKNV